MLPTKFQFIWTSGLRGEDFFRNQPIRNKNCLWRPCFLADRNEMSNLYRGPFKDGPYQVSIHLAKRFQMRRFFQKSTKQKQEWPVAAMFVNELERNEQSLQRTCNLQMLPTKFRFIWPSGFRGEDLFGDGSRQNEQTLERTFHRCVLPSFISFG